MSDLIIFEYGGEQVAFDPAAEMWNLNAMHQAAGDDPNKAPRFWLRQAQTQELLAALADELTVSQDHSFVTTREGRNGGTWAHWQIAAAYAHYLNPKFYLQWNRWAMERYQQLATATPDDTRARLVSLEARVEALESGVISRRFLRPPLRERLTQGHMLILVFLDTAGERGMSTTHLLATCGLTRRNASSFFRRLHELRVEGLVSWGRRPVRITVEGSRVLAECQRRR